MLENVITNALEAMEGGGTLTVRTGALPAPRGAGEIEPTHFIEVRDTGHGMTAEFIQASLFRPFVTTKPKGLGLGMYEVHRAVARMEGRLRVTSEVGSGTCVRIEIGRRNREAPHGTAEVSPDR